MKTGREDAGHNGDSQPRRAAREAAVAALLQREDARRLLLPREVAAPWRQTLHQRFMVAANQPDFPADDDKRLHEATLRILEEAAWSVVQEMVCAIFTPPRREQLRSQLRAYRDQLQAAGDQQAAALVESLQRQLPRVTDPAKNAFVCLLCYDSLQAAR